QELLATAGLSLDQDGTPGGADAHRFLEEAEHRRALPEDAGQDRVGRSKLLEAAEDLRRGVRLDFGERRVALLRRKLGQLGPCLDRLGREPRGPLEDLKRLRGVRLAPDART